MSQDIRIEDWQWERLMEVLGAIDQNTQPTVTTISTAKPEPVLPPEAIAWRKKGEESWTAAPGVDALNLAIARAEAAEARVKEWEVMCQEFGILGNEVARVARLLHLRATNRKDGALAERERIIALLDCEGDMPDGCPALLVRNVTSGETLNAAQLRAVLEP